MLMKLINRRVEICRMLHKKSEGAAQLAAVYEEQQEIEAFRKE